MLTQGKSKFQKIVAQLNTQTISKYLYDLYTAKRLQMELRNHRTAKYCIRLSVALKEKS